VCLLVITALANIPLVIFADVNGGEYQQQYEYLVSEIADDYEDELESLEIGNEQEARTSLFYRWRQRGGFFGTDLGFEFYRAFIRDNRYQLFFAGMRTTITLSALALTIGTVIGLIVTFLSMSKIKYLRWISTVYLDIIRGTPLMVQAMLWYFVFLSGLGLPRLLIGGIAFGFNSGAYLSEIFRAGIMSIDKGQTEAGRSLGMTRFQTMRLIVLPQAIKNVLPAIANEYIVLIKETAIVFVIAVPDIMRAANVVISLTFSPMMPLLGATVMYYVIIKTLSIFFRWMEKRLRKADAR